MTDNGRVCPGMLGVQPHGAVLEDNQVEGLIEPPVTETGRGSVGGSKAESRDGSRRVSALPVVAFPVEEGLGVAVQRLDWVLWVEALLRVVQGDEEGGLLDGVQGNLVPSAAEVGVASVCPRRSAKQRVGRPSLHLTGTPLVDRLH